MRKVSLTGMSVAVIATAMLLASVSPVAAADYGYVSGSTSEEGATFTYDLYASNDHGGRLYANSYMLLSTSWYTLGAVAELDPSGYLRDFDGYTVKLRDDACSISASFGGSSSLTGSSAPIWVNASNKYFDKAWGKVEARLVAYSIWDLVGNVWDFIRDALGSIPPDDTMYFYIYSPLYIDYVLVY